jgi:eukaryotic-like serine/threonine-protein kinase
MNLVGSKLGDYHVIQKLDQGGMGVIFKVRDEKRQQDCAVKVMNQTYATKEDIVAFRHEGEIGQVLKHPNIVKTLRVAEQEGLLYIVMELLSGESLMEYMKRNSSIGVNEAIGICIQIGLALDHMHRCGLVHGDVKPANINIHTDSVTGNKVAILYDFGLSRYIKSRSNPYSSPMGTPGYASPEQHLNKLLDSRSDIFSLGCVLYAMLAKEPPFESVPCQPPAILSDIDGSVSDKLSETINKSLAIDPAQRFSTMGEMLRAVANAADNGWMLFHYTHYRVVRQVYLVRNFLIR